MPINPNNPVIIPEKTLDKIWAKVVSTTSEGPNKKSFCVIELTPYNDAGDVGAPIFMGPYDVAQECQTDPDAAEIYSKFLAWIEKKAKAEGKI